MKARPILFSVEMIRALLAGRKTLTRRIVKPQPDAVHDGDPYWHIGGYRLRPGAANPLACPHGRPGDLLWCRESHWRFTGCAEGGKAWPGFIDSPTGSAYDARCYDDYAQIGAARMSAAVVRVPSIHMPRWASRITLLIEDVRVERLQDISEADAIAEGCPAVSLHDLDCDSTPPSAHFRALWQSLHGPDSWAANPWVWRIQFRPILKNVDDYKPQDIAA